jgi:hypothetical protein
MSPSEIVVQGTLHPDGTLQLDEKPDLAPGRVTVVLRQAVQPAPLQDTWWQYMQRSRAQLEASGHHFMNEQEMTAWIEELRSDDDRIEQAYGKVSDTEQ